VAPFASGATTNSAAETVGMTDERRLSEWRVRQMRLIQDGAHDTSSEKPKNEDLVNLVLW
jgi:hypothetical protein